MKKFASRGDEGLYRLNEHQVAFISKDIFRLYKTTLKEVKKLEVLENFSLPMSNMLDRLEKNCIDVQKIDLEEGRSRLYADDFVIEFNNNGIIIYDTKGMTSDVAVKWLGNNFMNIDFEEGFYYEDDFLTQIAEDKIEIYDTKAKKLLIKGEFLLRARLFCATGM